MQHTFTPEYWEDDGWYAGRLAEVPGVFRKGETLDELKENVASAYRMMRETAPPTIVAEHSA